MTRSLQCPCDIQQDAKQPTFGVMATLSWQNFLLACLLRRVGLVLEWLYADAFNDALTAIVPFMAQSTLFSNSSTAQQTSQQVLNQLVQCLQQQAQLTVQLEQVKEVCHAMSTLLVC